LENRTSSAEAGYGNVIYGKGSAVPFQDRALTLTQKAVHRSGKSMAE